MSISPPPPRYHQGEVVYSTFLLRLIAYMADGLVLGVALLTVFYLLGLEQDSFGAAVANVVISAGFFIYCHGRWGATPGKMLFSLQVISINNRPVSYLQSLLRYSPYLVAGCIALLLPGATSPQEGGQITMGLELRVFLTVSLCWYVVSVGYMLNRPDRRTLHDLLAYTVVVVRKEGGR